MLRFPCSSTGLDGFYFHLLPRYCRLCMSCSLVSRDRERQYPTAQNSMLFTSLSLFRIHTGHSPDRTKDCFSEFMHCRSPCVFLSAFGFFVHLFPFRLTRPRVLAGCTGSEMRRKLRSSLIWVVRVGKRCPIPFFRLERLPFTGLRFGLST